MRSKNESSKAPPPCRDYFIEINLDVSCPDQAYMDKFRLAFGGDLRPQQTGDTCNRDTQITSERVMEAPSTAPFRLFLSINCMNYGWEEMLIIYSLHPFPCTSSEV